jgi:dynein heavy chain
LAAVEKAAPAADVPTRIQNINDYFTFLLYSNVCRSLFERHKLLFSFLLCTRLMQNEGLVDHHTWRFLLSGGLTTPEVLPNPAPAWLPERAWQEV